LLGLESLFIGIVRCIHPLDALLDSIHDSLLVFLGDLLTELLLVGYSVLHRVEVVLERVLGFHLALHLFVLLSELLSLFDHAINFVLVETSLVVGDGDLLLLASTLVLGTHIEDTVGIDLEGHIDLRDATRSRRDS